MNKAHIYIYLFILIFSSCAGADAVKYNDFLIESYNETDRIVGNFYVNANRLLQENSLSQLSGYAETAVNELDKRIERISRLEAPKGSYEYKNAVAAYIQAQVRYVNTVRDEYSQVTDTTDDAEFNRIERLIEQTIRDRIQKNDAIIEAQRSFAQKHNFKE